MNRVDRLVAIVLLLQSRRVIRAQEIADHFGLSVRTVYRDLRALEEAGVPLTAEAGVGYSLVPEYHLPPIMFTHEEASALAIGGKFVEKLTDENLNKNMRSALLKIFAVLPRDKQHYLSTLQETTRVIPTVRSTKLDDHENTISLIQHAIANQKILKLRYFAHYSREHSFRKIEPLGLIFYSNNWHLIAWCRLRNDYRDFRLSRIQKLESTDDDFLTREDFSLNDYFKKMGTFENPIEVKVRFPDYLAKSLTNREYFGFVDEQIIGRDHILSFLVDSLEWMSYWLFSYGPCIEVLSPQALREKMVQHAKATLKNYPEAAPSEKKFDTVLAS